MDRFTWKAPDGTYQIDDCMAVHKTLCYDENFKNPFDIYEGKAIDKLGKYEDAEEQGLLLKLPCKVGDTVYQNMITGLDEDKKLIYKVFEARVFKYTLDSMNLCFWTETKDRYQYRNEMPISAFGETVFVTKEEAEQALAKMKEV